MRLSRRRQQEEPELNVTSFIDVVLLLLIFFVTTTTFMKDGQIQLQLPRANGSASAATTPPVQLSIDARGRYFLNGQELVNSDIETVKLALGKAELKSGDPLVIRADAKTTHQSVVIALDAAGQLGITHISIATDNTK